MSLWQSKAFGDCHTSAAALVRNDTLKTPPLQWGNGVLNACQKRAGIFFSKNLSVFVEKLPQTLEISDAILYNIIAIR